MPPSLNLAEEALECASKTRVFEAALRPCAALAEEGCSLLNQAVMRVKGASGAIEGLSAVQVEQRFGFKYLPKLTIDKDCPLDEVPALWKETQWTPPAEAGRAAFQHDFGRQLRDGILGQSQKYGDAERKAWLYGDQIRRGQTANLYVAKINDNVGHGLFAGEHIRQGQMLGEYTGRVRERVVTASWLKPEEDVNNFYMFNYGDRSLIDAQKMGNITRFANHSSDTSNAAIAHVIDDGADHIVLVASEDIPKDSQVLFDYGPEYWTGRTPEQL